jgi:transcriptional regulator with GAF, ATPase, and Fis domain
MDTDLLSDTFVELADTMVADFDIIDFLHMLIDRSVALLGASAAGVVLADPRGELRVAAASSEEAGLLELFQLQNDQGPCLECFRTGRPVTATDLTGPDPRWPRFAQAATQAGFATVEALPMRLRGQVIGALNLFGAGPGRFDAADVRIGQALADVATIGLLHERNVRRQHRCRRDVEFAADRYDGVSALTADGKRGAKKKVIDFMWRHQRPPISVPGRTRSSCAVGDADVTAGARGALGLTPHYPPQPVMPVAPGADRVISY